MSKSPAKPSPVETVTDRDGPPQLKILTGVDSGRTFILTDRETVLGRYAHCNIVLRDTSVSRRHARIMAENDGYYLEDLRSQHGTMLNGRQIALRERLTHHDTIQLGQEMLTFLDEKSRAASQILRSEHDASSIVLTAWEVITGQRPEAKAAPDVQLRAVMDMFNSIGGMLDAKQLFPRVLECAFRVFPQTSRGYVLLTDSREGRLILGAMKQDGKSNAAPVISRQIARRVLHDGQAVLSKELEEPPKSSKGKGKGAAKADGKPVVRYIMCAPLLGTARKPLGMLHLDTTNRRRAFSHADLEVLVNLAQLAGQALAMARLHQAELKFDRHRRDLSTVRQLQTQFVPQDPPALAGYLFADYQRTTDEAGGHYRVYLPAGEQRVAMLLGTVPNRGLPGAITSARLVAEVRCLLAAGQPLPDVLTGLDRFATAQAAAARPLPLVLCVLDAASHRLQIGCAGGQTPWVRRAGGELETPPDEFCHAALGSGNGGKFAVWETRLEKGDAVLLSSLSATPTAALPTARLLPEDDPLDDTDAEPPPSPLIISSASDVTEGVLAEAGDPDKWIRRYFQRLEEQHDQPGQRGEDVAVVCFQRQASGGR